MRKMKENKTNESAKTRTLALFILLFSSATERGEGAFFHVLLGFRVGFWGETSEAKEAVCGNGAVWENPLKKKSAETPPPSSARTTRRRTEDAGTNGRFYATLAALAQSEFQSFSRRLRASSSGTAR